MEIIWIVLIAAAILAILILAASYACFVITFHISDKAKKPRGEFDLPEGIWVKDEILVKVKITEK